MSTELRHRLFLKCMEIYDRKKSLWPIDRFLNRLDLEGTLQCEVWTNDLLPEIRKRYFSTLTVEACLLDALSVYRSSLSRSSALLDIWWKLDWEIPFNFEEYSEFVERLEELLKNEQNPPNQEDWDYLNEWLGK